MGPIAKSTLFRLNSVPVDRQLHSNSPMFICFYALLSEGCQRFLFTTKFVIMSIVAITLQLEMIDSLIRLIIKSNDSLFAFYSQFV